MELKTSIPLLVVRQFGKCDSSQNPLRRCDGSCRGLVEALTDASSVRVLIPTDPFGEVEGN